MDDAALMAGIDGYLAATGAPPIEGPARETLVRALYSLKERSKTYPELLEKGHFALISRPVEAEPKAAAALDDAALDALGDLTQRLADATWQREALEGVVSDVAAAHGTKLGRLASPIRAALAGRTVTPSVFDMMLVLGREETSARLSEASRPAQARSA